MAIIQNSTYANVEFADSPVTLTCKDNNGNTFSRTTIAVDSSAGIVDINLPFIPDLADDLLTEVVVIIADDTNNVTINTPIGQQIGSATMLTIASGGGNGQNVILRPVSEGYWSVIQTA
jgi:hypothetical protein